MFLLLKNGPLLGNSHNHEQLSLNTASYVLVQSSGKIAQIVDTSHRDWWLVIDFFIMLVQFLSEIFGNLK